MTIKPLPKSDRDVFYNDPRVKTISSMLIETDDILYNEIIALLNLTKFSDFQTQLYSLYSILQDKPELFGKFSEKYLPHLVNMYKDHHLIANLRGAILEKFVDELLYIKYKDRSLLCLNCHVMIDDWRSPRTVDNFSYSGTDLKGECFECKIKPFTLETHDVDNLKDIRRKSNLSINPCIACFVSKEAIELKLKELKINSREIFIFGFEDLKYISTDYE